MKIGVLGTGMVGQTISAKLSEPGLDVMIGTRDAAQTMLHTDPGPYNQPPFSAWLKQHPGIQPGNFAETAEHGEVVINATNIFLSGNDPEAKSQVATWLSGWFGWKHILDLGDITTARGTEMYLPLWLRLWGALGTGMVNINIVK